jgi:hypothetical protein
VTVNEKYTVFYETDQIDFKHERVLIVTTSYAVSITTAPSDTLYFTFKISDTPTGIIITGVMRSITIDDVTITPFAWYCNLCGEGIAPLNVTDPRRTMKLIHKDGLVHHCKTETHCDACGIFDFKTDYEENKEWYLRECEAIYDKGEKEMEDIVTTVTGMADGGKEYLCNRYLTDGVSSRRLGLKMRGHSVKHGIYKLISTYREMEKFGVEEYKNANIFSFQFRDVVKKMQSITNVDVSVTNVDVSGTFNI